MKMNRKKKRIKLKDKNIAMALARQCTGHDYEPTNKNWVAVEATRLCAI